MYYLPKFLRHRKDTSQFKLRKMSQKSKDINILNDIMINLKKYWELIGFD